MKEPIIQANQLQFNPESKKGHYESYFMRANHPKEKEAFWIRYTIFSPINKPEHSIGELWAVYFNGKTNEHVVSKKEAPIHHCTFSDSIDMKIQNARLNSSSLNGSIIDRDNSFKWDLSYESNEKPLLLFSPSLYQGSFPKAKSLVPKPLAKYNGTLNVNDKVVKIDNWLGSQNHNWGVKHTDHYAWGQVAGFDNFPDSFLELATARIKLGFIWSPFLTPIVVRHKGKEYALNSLIQAYKNQGRFTNSEWAFKGRLKDVSIEGVIRAPKESFVKLTYFNPPGGNKTCLNSKLASCELNIKGSDFEDTLETKSRAAFEILS